jgi:hypothetical protein
MADPEQPQDQDVVLLHSPTDDGGGVRVVRARNGQVELGEVRPTGDGKPLTGELVTLRPREGAPRMCDVEVHYRAPTPAPSQEPRPPEPPRALAARTGPAQVATSAYRDNWEATFGNKSKSPRDLN